MLVAALISAVVAASGYPLSVTVSPNPMPYNHPGSIFTVHAKTGAECIGHVQYTTNHKAVSFKEQLVKTSGTIVWKWHEESKGTAGVASVSCTYHGVTERAQVRFSITHTS